LHNQFQNFPIAKIQNDVLALLIIVQNVQVSDTPKESFGQQAMPQRAAVGNKIKSNFKKLITDSVHKFKK
jgi:hypothetical protein